MFITDYIFYMLTHLVDFIVGVSFTYTTLIQLRKNEYPDKGWISLERSSNPIVRAWSTWNIWS